jgi:hypothetical protein
VLIQATSKSAIRRELATPSTLTSATYWEKTAPSSTPLIAYFPPPEDPVSSSELALETMVFITGLAPITHLNCPIRLSLGQVRSENNQRKVIDGET